MRFSPSVTSEITDGENRRTHIDYVDGQRTWQQINDSNSLVNVSVDSTNHMLTISKPRLQTTADGGTTSVRQEKTHYTYTGDRLASVTYDGGSFK